MRKNSLKLPLASLIVAVVFISIGYAMYSTVLNVEGTANLERSVWSVHYDKDSINVLSGVDGEYKLVNPASVSVNDSQNSLSFVTDLNLNEESSFTIDVVNDGTFDARVNDVNLMVSYKTASDDNYISLANVGSNTWSNDYLDFSVLWTEGKKNILDTLDIEQSTTKNMTIVVRYKQPDDASSLPGEDVSFKFNLAVDYTQSSGMRTSESVASKITADVSTAAEVVNIFQDHMEDDVVLRLSDDIDLSSYSNLPITNNTTVEFNGHTITTAPNAIKATSGGVLRLEDTTGIGGITADRGAVVVEQGGTLIINGGIYTTTNYTRGSGINAKDGAKVIINNGTINAAYYAIGSDGIVDVTINGGELNSTATSKNGTWAYSVSISNGKFTMNGGKISGVHGGLALVGDVDAIISGGEIYEHESENGANDAYYDIYITDASSLTINDGKFVNDGTRSAIYSITNKDINIKGGTYIARGTELFNGTTANNIKVTGGKFSHDVTPFIISGSQTLNSNTNLYEVN